MGRGSLIITTRWKRDGGRGGVSTIFSALRYQRDCLFFFLPNNLFLDFKLKNSLIIERDRDVPGAALGPVLPLPPTSIEWKDRLFGWVYGRDERILRMTFSANGSRHGG